MDKEFPLNINLKLLCGADLIESFCYPRTLERWRCWLMLHSTNQQLLITNSHLQTYSKLPRLIYLLFIYRLKTLWAIMDWWSFHVLDQLIKVINYIRTNGLYIQWAGSSASAIASLSFPQLIYKHFGVYHHTHF